MRGNNPMFRLKLHISVNISVNSRLICTNLHEVELTFRDDTEWGITTHVLTKTTFWSISTSLPWHDSAQNLHEVSTNFHRRWIRDNNPWTMTKKALVNISVNSWRNYHKPPQTMTWTIMMTQKELCIKPYGFLVMNDTV